MKNKFHIDHLFRNKLFKKAYSVNQDDWAAMAKILDKDDKKRRFILPFSWLSAGIAAALLYGFVIFRQEQTPQTIPNSEVIAQEKIKQNFASNPDNEPAKAIAKPSDTNISEAKTSNHSSIINPKTSHKIQSTNPSSQNREVNNGAENTITEELHTVLLEESIAFLESKIPQFKWSIIGPKISPVKVSTYADDMFEPHLSLGLGFDVLASKSGFGTWSGGLVGAYHLDPQWTIETGLRYYSQENAGIYSKIRQDEEFGFGTTVTTYGMQVKKLAYLSLPIGVGYAQGKTKFSAGYLADFLLGAQGEVQEVSLMKTVERSKVMEVVQTLSTGWLDTGPFRQNNGRVFTSVRREVLPNLFFGLEVQYRLSEVLKYQPDLLEAQQSNKLFFGVNMQMFLP